MTITQSFSQFNFTSIPQSKPTTTNHRLAGLRRFAIAITFLNILGHTFLGFEQSWAQPFVSLLAAYFMELSLETVESFSLKKTPRFWGNITTLIDFLLPAHITGLAVAMLLYANDRLFPIAFAAAVAIASKYIFRVTMGNKSRHFLNPSNFGISVTLLLFPWIGIAPPYQFTENLYGWADWIFPIIIVCTGTFLNARFTHKLPLIMGWVGGFFLQAVIRSYVFGTPLIAALLPMTGVAFVLFTFYMISDPGTTPITPKNQVIFGLSVAAAYGVLMMFHVVFGMFFGLTFFCFVRGLIYYLKPLVESKKVSVLSLSTN
ncbi:MAG: enediyne biosynthesis protein UnbU [Crocosphaera sp.]|nr:enediyne biosynthesis protein UnbU [Crocosphaera sp.]